MPAAADCPRRDHSILTLIVQSLAREVSRQCHDYISTLPCPAGWGIWPQLPLPLRVQARQCHIHFPTETGVHGLVHHSSSRGCRSEEGIGKQQQLPQVERLAPSSPQGLQWKETSRKLHMPTPSPHPPLRTPAPGKLLLWKLLCFCLWALRASHLAFAVCVCSQLFLSIAKITLEHMGAGEG